MNRVFTTVALALALGLSPALAQNADQRGSMAGMMGGGCPMIGMMGQGMMGPSLSGQGMMAGRQVRIGASTAVSLI